MAADLDYQVHLDRKVSVTGVYDSGTDTTTWTLPYAESAPLRVILGGTVYELPCHRQPVFEGICAGESYPVAERWCPNHICPPLTSGMTEDDALTVGRALVKHLGGQGKSQQTAAAG